MPPPPHLASDLPRQDFYAGSLALACDTRLLVTIPLWFRPGRLAYLADMVRTLAEFPITQMDMVILTQTQDDDEIETVRRLTRPYESATKSFRIHSETYLPDQFSLCWQHRKMIEDVFLKTDQYTHFAYFEDDIRFSFLNLCYFLYFRKGLAQFGLLPSFVRVEYNSKRLGYFATDRMGHFQGNAHTEKDGHDILKPLAGEMHVTCDGQMFVGLKNPYCALYVLDRELATEFVASSSFDRARSESVTHWGVPERAAMGLCFENLPEGWRSRYVVPVDVAKVMPAHWSWVYHLPNNFTNQSDQPWGQCRMDEFFSS
jgi:hypothetical protein